MRDRASVANKILADLALIDVLICGEVFVAAWAPRLVFIDQLLPLGEFFLCGDRVTVRFVLAFAHDYSDTIGSRKSGSSALPAGYRVGRIDGVLSLSAASSAAITSVISES